MSRWLLNTVPTWLLALVLIGGFVVVALAGLALVRRLAPSVTAGDHNEFTGMMSGIVAAVYGVFLAFAIVALYEQFHEASATVQVESAALEKVIRSSGGLDPAMRADLRDAVREYRDAVTADEWKAMEEGLDSESAWVRLPPVYRALRRQEPEGARETAFYAEALSAANDIGDGRRDRLHAAGESLPGPLVVLLWGGAVLTLAFTILFGVRNPRLHTALVASYAVLLGFSMLLAVVLDHPYSGDVSVSSAPFYDGALGDL